MGNSRWVAVYQNRLLLKSSQCLSCGLLGHGQTPLLEIRQYPQSGWLDSTLLFDSFVISMKFHCHKKTLCCIKSILHRACPCLPPTTVFYTEHALAYPQQQYFTQSMPLAYPQQQYFTQSMPLLTPNNSILHRACPLLTPNNSILQRACPCLPPTSFEMLLLSGGYQLYHNA